MRRDSIKIFIYLIIAGQLLAFSEKEVNAKGGLKVRNEPSTNGQVLVTLKDRSKVLVLEETGGEITLAGTTGKWTKIKFYTVEGWVFGGFLKPTLPSPVANGDSLDFKNYQGVQITGYSGKDLKKPEFMEISSFQYPVVLHPKGRGKGMITFNGCNIIIDSLHWRFVDQILEVKLSGQRMEAKSEVFCPYYLLDKKGIAAISDKFCIDIGQLPADAKKIYTDDAGKTLFYIDTEPKDKAECKAN